MRIALFYHSLLSDWNHGNAHFLRGVVSELLARGHDVCVYEPKDSWSRENLILDHGEEPIQDFRRAYPHLDSVQYELGTLDLGAELDGVELVIVHEWNDHALVRAIGQHHDRNPGYRLLFHDTHHRSVTAPESMENYDLSHYDGVLAFGESVRDIYLRKGWAANVWTWHEAADVRVFRPLRVSEREGDLVWVGNWGDDERTAELYEFLLRPVKQLALEARVYGVRYPRHALEALAETEIEYGGWLPNHAVPLEFARYRVTVHVPRRPYVKALPGIPTIRPFEAMACGIPLVSAPWSDTEGLFTPGRDFLVARNGAEMARHLRSLLSDPQMAEELARRGRSTILDRHTCAHRVDQLFSICRELDSDSPRELAHANSLLRL